MNRETTEWFDWKLKPPCPGVYQRKQGYRDNTVYYARWTGGYWCAYEADMHLAMYTGTRSAYDDLPWRAVLTPWVERTDPVHPGVYLRQGNSNKPWSKWNGKYWLFSHISAKSAAGGRTRSMYQSLPWRGIQPWIIT